MTMMSDKTTVLVFAICKDIVDSYSGQMSFEKAKLGGLAVNVTMPDIE